MILTTGLILGLTLSFSGIQLRGELSTVEPAVAKEYSLTMPANSYVSDRKFEASTAVIQGYLHSSDDVMVVIESGDGVLYEEEDCDHSVRCITSGGMIKVRVFNDNDEPVQITYEISVDHKYFHLEIRSSSALEDTVDVEDWDEVEDEEWD
jgi:hypothetical protein